MTPKEIKEWMDDICNILVDLNISINNAKRLTESKYAFEDKIKGHGFLHHHWYQLRFIIVIQLAKLISDRSRTHKRNFLFLCNKIELSEFTDDFFVELRKFQPERYFEADTTEQGIRKIIKLTREDLDNNKVIIKKIIDARDQIYAHIDPIPSKKIPSLKELEGIIDLCNNIYNRISGELFKSHTDFDHTDSWNIDYVLRELCEMRMERFARIDKKMK